jgi:hypothetical protein
MKSTQNKIPLLLIFLFCIVTSLCAQTNDSLPPVHKGFFKKWKLVGIEMTLVRGQNYNNQKVSDLFSKAFPNQKGIERILFDLQTTRGFEDNKIVISPDVEGVANFNVVFKPRIINPKRWLSYSELVAGIFFSNQSSYIDLLGYTVFNNAYYDHFYTGYAVDITSAGFNLGGMLQSPSLGNAIALYAGCNVFGGYNYSRDIRLAEGRFYDSVISTYNSNYTVLSEKMVNTSFPKLTVGFYIPVGIKLNISQHSNISVEFNARCINYLMQTGWHTQWHRGFGLGYRYKFGKITNTRPIQKGAAAQPAPFY